MAALVHDTCPHPGPSPVLSLLRCLSGPLVTAERVSATPLLPLTPHPHLSSPRPPPLSSASLSPCRPDTQLVWFVSQRRSLILSPYSLYTLTPGPRPPLFPNTLPPTVSYTSIALLIHSLSQLACCLYSTHALKRTSPRAKTLSGLP